MTREEYVIEGAHPRDLPDCAAIETACDAQFPPGRFPGSPGSDNVPAKELLSGIADGRLWMARCDGRAAGFALARRYGSFLHLRQIAVLPEFQRMGIGSAFLDRLTEEAAEHGLDGITLTTFADISWNGPWYSSRGYRILSSEELENLPHVHDELQAEIAAGMTSRIAMIRLVGAFAP